MNNTIEKIKNKSKHYAPAFLAGIGVATAVSVSVIYRMNNPKDKISIAFPYGVYERMLEKGGLIINLNQERWILERIPNE